jgi:plastocyanin
MKLRWPLGLTDPEGWLPLTAPGAGDRMHCSLRTSLILAVTLVGAAVCGLMSQAAMLPLRIVIESASPYFEPASATVGAGSPILWENPTPSPHTVTHDGCVQDGPCAFDSGTVAPDQKFALSGLPAGRYSYHCRLHPIMRGTLVVTATPAQQT